MRVFAPLPLLFLSTLLSLSLAGCGAATPDGGEPVDAGKQGAPVGDTCTGAGECASGFCVTGVCCAAACDGECQACAATATGQADGTCAPAHDGSVCRAPSGACDVAETCSQGHCAADAVAPTSTTCRAAAGICNLPEQCDGQSKQCPTDLKKAANTSCRPAAGDCDLDDTCDGTSALCPDTYQPSSTLCRAAAGTCDAAEHCTGSSPTCPADGFLPATSVCRPSAGPCDSAELCSGTSANCPADTRLPNTTVCRASAGACDLVELCDGTNAACPVDTVATAGTSCRASVGVCDVPEACDGVSFNCPADAVLGAGVQCRASAGSCDPAELCTGASGLCPADVLAAATVVCRASAGICDAPELCTGTSAACPADLLRGTSFVCRNAVGLCDVTEFCTGLATTCPADTRVDAGVVCRPAAGLCDLAETCTGATDCPTDVFKPATALACGSYACTGNAAQCTNSCVVHADCAPDAHSICDGGACIAGKTVFITSTAFPTGNLGGLAGADALCQAHALDAGVSGNYKAWLSDSTVTAAARLAQPAVPIVVRKNGVKAIVANDWTGFLGTHLASINGNERGVVKSTGLEVFTGTTAAGASVAGQQCTNWTSNAANVQIGAGTVSSLGWSQFSVATCATPAALYCIEQ